jgi:hypothetical protein
MEMSKHSSSLVLLLIDTSKSRWCLHAPLANTYSLTTAAQARLWYGSPNTQQVITLYRAR